MQSARLDIQSALPQLRPDQVSVIAEMALETAGIRLDAGKLDFLQARLARRVLDSQAGSFKSYIELLGRDAAERQKFVESLTVHTTSFFRDEAQYDWLHYTALPELAQHRANIVFWSAACSTGQEGWTSLMVAEACRRENGQSFNCRLIGTDVSTAVLKQASRAIYFQHDMETVAAGFRTAFFLRSRNRDGRYRIAPDLRRNAEWRWGNLATGEGMEGIRADVVFLRNVLIYFDSQTQNKVVNRVVKGIRPGGYLVTGHSETRFKHPELITVKPSIFKKVGKS